MKILKFLLIYITKIIVAHHYIIPEILQGKDYSLYCNFWSVWINLYEIFDGIYPLRNYTNEVIEIYKEILNK